jgi:hypothetical protein
MISRISVLGLILIIILFHSCKKEEPLQPKHVRHYVGDLFGGGIILKIDNINGIEHGLIASFKDLSEGIQWTTADYQNILVPAGAHDMYDGMPNSIAIVAQAGEGIDFAAGLCRAYSASGDGGLHDWYLPSIWELSYFYDAAIELYLLTGDMKSYNFNLDSHYWSSTEGESFNAYFKYFYNGAATYYDKSHPCSVRAVRRF